MMKIARTPTILQMEATECGAAALGSILGYYGCYLTLEELRIACDVSRDGSRAINMLKAARHYGLDAFGIKASLEELREIPPPFIIFWEFNHFLVIEGIKKNKIYVNDPATGPRTITFDKLNKGFTGVCLIFEPTKQLIQSPKQALLRQSIKGPLMHNKQAFMLMALVSLFLIVPGIIIPGFNKIFIDNILIQNMHRWLNPLILGLAISMFLQCILIWLQQRVLLKFKMKLLLDLGVRLLWHILHLPMQFFYQRFAGDIEDRVNANDRIAQLLSVELIASFIGFFNMSFFALILIFINYKLAVVGILGALINVALLKVVLRRIEDKTRDFLQQYGRLTGIEMNSLQMIETIKATSLENDFFKTWSSKHAYIIGVEQQITYLNQLLILIPQLVYGLCNVAILSWGSWLIMQGHLTVGSLVAFQSLMLQFFTPLEELMRLAGNFQEIRGDLLRIQDVMNYKPDLAPTEIETQTSIQIKEPLAITARSVEFGYSLLTEPLISDLNLNIKAQSRVAFIGKTGSGKSTIAKLLMNLDKPRKGTICLNDRELATFSAEELANTMALVEQDIFLFKGTVRDNLTLWDDLITDEDLNEALKIALLFDELLARGGLNCELEEGGYNLSGGQRQRMEIARALVKKPKLLVLDEATASLDPSLEYKIYNNIKKLNITVIIITHRIRAVKDCDEIIILEHGKIIHRGKHEELLEVPLYKQMIALEERFLE